MRAVRSVVAAVLSSVALVGCSAMTDQPAQQQTPIDNTGPAPMMHSSGMIAVDKQTIVARVSAVEATAMLATLIRPTGDLSPGDVIVFTDANQVGIAKGVVTSVENSGGYVIPQVKFTVDPGGRAPVVNDLAFHTVH